MKTVWHLFITASLFAPVGLAACGESHAETAAKRAAAPSIPVTLAPVVRLAADAPLSVSGRVSHARDVKPAFKTGGLIKEILVAEGEQVVLGQVLARLDTREIDAGLAQARAALGKAQRDLTRAEQLVADNVLPGTTREDAATAATVARAQVAGLAFNRETATLVATAAGVVVKRLAEPGEVIGPGMPVVVIGEVAADHFQLEVGVPARELSRITLGASALVRLDGDAPNQPARPAVVVELAPTLTPGTDRLAVTLQVEGAAPRGLVGNATFAPRAEVTLPAVPATTLVEGLGQKASVWVPDPAQAGRVLAKEVVVAALRPDGMVLIARGLDGVAQVIDAGNAWLDADATVVVAPTSAEARK